jgi:dihydrofolate synthase/folylpolyglutamate synthase
LTAPPILEKIEARGGLGIASDLDKFKGLLSRLNHPQRDFPVIHVAGTNGKGSVAAMLESILRESGFKTGLYVSPHLSCVRERIRLGGRWIGENALAALLVEILKSEDAPLSYFELLTAAAFLCFSAEKVDVAVVEAGVGARRDATNVFDRPLAVVITSVDYDHAETLGGDLPSIAREKAGAFKAGSPAICPELKPAALEILRAEARKLAVPLDVIPESWHAERIDWEGNRQELTSQNGESLTLSVLGERQRRNASLAAAVLHRLPPDCRRRITPDSLRRGLSRLAWPGRFQVLRTGDKTVVIDGAHNAEAASNLRATWEKSPFLRREALWFLGFNRGKDAGTVLSILRPLMRWAAATQPPGARALESRDLARLLRRRAPEARIWSAPTFDEAFKNWLRSDGPPVAVVSGSLYLASRVNDLLAPDQNLIDLAPCPS